MRRRNAYYRRAAERAGVPRFWLDDAVQDLALAVWRARHAPVEWKRVVQLAAIDAARRYGPRGRHGNQRATLLPLTDRSGGETNISWLPGWIDAQRAVSGLSASQRRVLEKRLAGRPMTPRDSVALYSVRRILRAAVAA